MVTYKFFLLDASGGRGDTSSVAAGPPAPRSGVVCRHWPAAVQDTPTHIWSDAGFPALSGVALWLLQSRSRSPAGHSGSPRGSGQTSTRARGSCRAGRRLLRELGRELGIAPSASCWRGADTGALPVKDGRFLRVTLEPSKKGGPVGTCLPVTLGCPSPRKHPWCARILQRVAVAVFRVGAFKHPLPRRNR